MALKKGSAIILNLTLLIALIGAMVAVVVYRQNIFDWWTLQAYTPPSNIVSLADQTAMSQEGRTDFYVTEPQVEEKDAFNEHCSENGEKTVVLGCFTSGRIYIYNVTDSRLTGVVPVTAAHEMLHAAYARLGEGEKNYVNNLIEAELPKVTDKRLQDLIVLYSTSEPGEKLNEMHSILGTEYAILSPALEEYYKKYFTDRSKVVALAADYESNFTASQASIASINAKLDDLKKQISANSTNLDAQKSAIDAQSQSLDSLRSTNVAAYNAQVPGYNARVNQYNALVVQTRALIEQYNALVVQHNNEATAQNSLYQSLNSHYQTVN